ncbi:MAG TPA: hypothetical protein DCL38_08550 [Lachnospiraceae bacterium]|nr:hypothetical protein [Lachnospiraceae bacterium]
MQDEMDPDLFGDELYGEIITSTVKDEVNTVQINFHAIMPKGFTSGVCLEMLEDRSGRVYRILAASGNDYLGRMFVPEGAYTILDCYVEGDNTARYPMTIPSDFVAEQGKSYLLECVMSNLEEVEESGEFSPHSLRDGGLSEGSEEGLPEALSGVSSEEEKETMSVEYETAHELPWRDIRHQGEGTAELFVEGISKQRVELLVEITASGGYKKGEYRYSTDKGETWSDTLVIGIATERINNTASGEFTGLSLRFENEEYLLYDVYGLSTRIEYEQESVSNNGKGIVNFCSDDVIYDDNYSIVLKVVKTGTLGTGVFRYSLNGGFLWSEDVLTPEKGLFLIPDTGILVEFFDNGGEFMVRDVYKTKIKGDMSQHDHTPVIAGMLVVLFMVMAGVYHHYSSQRDGADRYELMRYERVR